MFQDGQDDKNAFASNTDKKILLILLHPVHLVLVLPYIGLNSVFPA